MWCENCNCSSYSSDTKVRITNDGREIIIKTCGNCKAKTEIEYVRHSTVRVTTDPKSIKKKTSKKRRLSTKK